VGGERSAGLRIGDDANGGNDRGGARACGGERSAIEARITFEEGGWIYVHLEGDPGRGGISARVPPGAGNRGWLRRVSAGMMHSTNATGNFPESAHEMLWPKIDASINRSCRASSKGCAHVPGRSWMWTTIVAFNCIRGAAGLLRAMAEQAAKDGASAESEEPWNCSASWPREAGRKTGRS